MGKIKLRITLVLTAACFAFATLGVALLPVKAFADTASDTVAAQQSRNNNLVVKYDLDETATGNNAQLTGYKWDNSTQTFVVDPSAVATVQNHVNNNWVGTVTSVEGVEGGGALSFTGKAHARANFSLPADATGMTVSLWVKNVNTYWSSLVEFWDGTDGGRFGKGTMQGNGGRRNEADPWSANCPAHNSATIAEGGGWDSFVINVNNNDKGSTVMDPMVADRWYQVTYTFTSTEMRAYRDGELKQTFNTLNDAPAILKSIMKAVTSGKGKLGIRLGHDANDGDILDDFRIYNGAMSAEEVLSLYGEYTGIMAIGNKTVRIEGIDGEYTVNKGNNIKVESGSAEFPKILIGGVTTEDVSYDAETKVYSATGTDFTYSYTVGEYNRDERVAVVTYTAGSVMHTFTVTHVNSDMPTAKITNLELKLNGSQTNIPVENFNKDGFSYTVNLSPDVYDVKFVVAVEGAAGENGSNVEEVNENIVFNGENEITTTTTGDALTYTYKITLIRERADDALPTVGGVQLGLATQNIYVDELPSSVAESAVAPVYPNGSEVQDFAYNAQTHTVTFKIADKALGNKSSYTVAYKTKQEGHLAQWSFETSESNANKVFPGKRWDAAQGAYVDDSQLKMTVRSGQQPGQDGKGTPVTDQRSATAATKVSGVMGNGIELGAWAYTTAKIPAVTGGTTGFTFSTWMKTSGNVWEAVFTVLGSEHGTILEKGNMQMHNVSNGQPVNGWEHLHNSVGDWANGSLNSDEKKAEYFNTPVNGASYVFYTVTVTYVNGVGTIKFYKDGELAVTFFDHADGGNDKAGYIIGAINAGASVGLHRHHYDGGQTSRFDETNIYAYAMTAEEVKNTYDSVAELLAASPEYYEVEGLGYPQEMLLGGATSVSSGANGLKTGVTQSGVSYSYTPLTVETTPQNDEAGMQVTFSKNGNLRTATVKFRRRLTIEAERLGYKLGDNGVSVPIEVPASSGIDIIVKVAADADLSSLKAGDIAVKYLEGDNNAQHYATQFYYSASTQTATVRCSYTLYEGFDTLYTIHFEKKNTGTFNAVTVTGGKNELQLTKEDFTENSYKVAVDDLQNFTLTVSVALAEGASLAGGGTEKTFTKNDLTDGKLSVTVTSENGDSVVYYLVPFAHSSDATLSALTAGEYGLNFAAGTTEYTLTVNEGEGANVFAAIEATATDSNATVKKIYDKTENVITITVTAEDGVTVQKYFIEIEEQSTDATLSRILVDGTAIAGFDPEKTAYTVKYKDTMPQITATPNSDKAKGASVSAADDNGKVTITVTAESGATKEYTVTLAKKSSDASLKELTLNGVKITFEGNAAVYQAPAGTRINKIIVSAKTAEGAVAVHEVKEAEKQIIVTVTAEDGTTARYTVTVNNQAHTPPEGGVTEDNSPKTSGCNSSTGDAAISVAAIALLLGMVLVVKKVRKTR